MRSSRKCVQTGGIRRCCRPEIGNSRNHGFRETTTAQALVVDARFPRGAAGGEPAIDRAPGGKWNRVAPGAVTGNVSVATGIVATLRRGESGALSPVVSGSHRCLTCALGEQDDRQVGLRTCLCERVAHWSVREATYPVPRLPESLVAPAFGRRHLRPPRR